jgi:mRNA interferase RelE/StbE
MWRLVVARDAQKKLASLPEPFRRRISAKLNYLAHDPYMGKKLKGELIGQRAVRVWPYRIVYEVKRQEVAVLVLHINHRQGVYK